MADVDNSIKSREADLFRAGYETGIRILLEFGPEMRVQDLVDAIVGHTPQMDVGTARAIILTYEKQGVVEPLLRDAIARFPAGSLNADLARQAASGRAERVRRHRSWRKAAD